MTKDTNAAELQETELDTANGGFRLEVDADPFKGPKHKKAENGLMSLEEIDDI